MRTTVVFRITVVCAILCGLLMSSASAQTLYKFRWYSRERPWSTNWETNQARPTCAHRDNCNCRSQGNYCGAYQQGQTAYYWPNGCTGARWLIQCEVQWQVPPAPQVQYKSRWELIIRGPGGQFINMGWTMNQSWQGCTMNFTTYCGCPGKSSCGTYRSGQLVNMWMSRCDAAPSTYRCVSVRQ
jgi:hypothetical protein